MLHTVYMYIKQASTLTLARRPEATKCQLGLVVLVWHWPCWLRENRGRNPYHLHVGLGLSRHGSPSPTPCLYSAVCTCACAHLISNPAPKVAEVTECHFLEHRWGRQTLAIRQEFLGMKLELSECDSSKPCSVVYVFPPTFIAGIYVPKRASLNPSLSVSASSVGLLSARVAP